MGTGFSKGAEWRKWDLHFHTPSSHDYQNKSITNDSIISALLSKEISVVAITDHHLIDIQRIKQLQKIGEPKGITVLPGIEILSDSRGHDPIHFIGIFSETSNIDYIWGQIKNKTNISKIEGESKNPDEIYCDLLQTAKLIKELGGIVTIHAGKKTNTIENITHSLPHTSAQKEDIAKIIDIFEVGNESDELSYKTHVIKHLKQSYNLHHPIILCSDNHNCVDFKLKQNCWIKADPNFEGLKQALNEPEDRVFIGEKPEIFDRVQKNRTRYIKELQINAIEGYDGSHGKWFKNVSIPLNKELVAIIGHKGSGKSALTDIVSLCSNYHDDEDFSFLTTKKFREKNGAIANYFRAKLTWESGYADEIGLNDDTDDISLKGVKYIPQGQFERLTNGINSAKEFQNEIEKVVFSHIDDSEKLGAHSFDDLIEKKKNIIETQIQGLYDEIESLNNRIIKLEQKEIPAYRKDIENRLKLKEDELKSLIEPSVVSNPNDDPEKKKQNEAIIIRIDKMKEELEKLETDLKSKQEEKGEVLIALTTLKDTKKEIELKVCEFERFVASKKAVLFSFNLDIEKIVSFKTDFSELEQLVAGNENKLNQIKIILGEVATEAKISPLSKMIEEKQSELAAEQNKLDSDQKKYQEYLKHRKIWENERNQITGSVTTPETISFYKKEISYLDLELHTEIEELCNSRKNTVRNIFQLKQEVIAIYKDVKTKLNEIIENNSDVLKDYRIELAATLVRKSNFNTDFLSFINQGKAGTFYSRDGGEKKLTELISEVNFDDEDSLVWFLDNTINVLRYDKRENQKEAERVIADQIKDVLSFYNYLYKLEFVDYNYQLKQGGKGIEQLSPGERGALLLVFYLLLDKNNIPLIIDQPEDNLDNHSVAKILVPFIRKAKFNRQIIMVTHNPNLAVVADAEQVIYVNLDKENNYEFSFLSGSIENKEVNNKIVEVLEGAMPAFNKRRHKYYD
jgi:ABC-type lipoprotein export system ATPase subunit